MIPFTFFGEDDPPRSDGSPGDESGWFGGSHSGSGADGGDSGEGGSFGGDDGSHGGHGGIPNGCLPVYL